MARPLAGLIPALALTAAWAGAADAGAPPADRYGPSPAAAPLPDVYATPAQAYADRGRETMRAPPARLLTWPGKASLGAPVPSAPLPAPTAQPYAQSYPQSARAAPSLRATPSYPAPRYAAPSYAAPVAAPQIQVDTVSPRFAAPIPSPAAPQLPYFAAPTPGAPPPATTSLSGPLASAAPAPAVQHARLYSVHRAYGMQPDPAPIPPQFFAQTADLSEPATAEPIPSRAANAATRNAVNAARLASTEAN